MTTDANHSTSPSRGRRRAEWGGQALRMMWALIFLVFPLGAALWLVGPVRIWAVAVVVVFGLAWWLLGSLSLARRQRGQNPGGAAVAAWTGCLLAAAALVAMLGSASAGLLPWFPWLAWMTLSMQGLWIVSIASTVAGVGAALGADTGWVLPVVIAGAGVTALLARRKTLSDEEADVARRQLVVSRERERLARDLHDGLGHALTAIGLRGELIARLMEQGHTDRASEEAGHVQELSRTALAELQRTLDGLHVLTFDDALRQTRRTLEAASIRLRIEGDGARVPAEHQIVLAFILREAVTNGWL